MMTAVESYLAVRRARRLHPQQPRMPPAQLCTLCDGATADPYPYGHGHRVGQLGGLGCATAHTRYQTVCRFGQYLRLEDPQHELPPTNHFGYRKRRRVPHIYSREEIASLVLAALRLPPADGLQPQTYAALISLLAATGLRISEALHLRVSDLTANGLLIRSTKFQKTRLVPLHDTVVTGLARYLKQRQERRLGGDDLFVSDDGQPLVYWKVHQVFRILLKAAGLKPSGGRWPRIHELRHYPGFRTIPSNDWSGAGYEDSGEKGSA